MKQILLIILTFGLLACNYQPENTKVLQKRIDSLEIKLADTYKPGLGDFMGSIKHITLNYGLQDKTKTGNLPTLKYTN